MKTEAKDYKKDKEAGLVELKKIGRVFVLARKQWDINSGKEVAPTIVPFPREQLEAQKKELVAQIQSINDMLKDMKAIETEPEGEEDTPQE